MVRLRVCRCRVCTRGPTGAGGPFTETFLSEVFGVMCGPRCVAKLTGRDPEPEMGEGALLDALRISTFGMLKLTLRAETMGLVEGDSEAGLTASLLALSVAGSMISVLPEGIGVIAGLRLTDVVPASRGQHLSMGGIDHARFIAPSSSAKDRGMKLQGRRDIAGA
mmetsp:Transcript_4178/g.5201  ORF Transcript_4178/g.5201 Transcript_4178/m.5201 type:complete len:165 (+) Transcript_4178:80-574(+)